MILGNETIYHGIQVRKKIMDFITRYIIQHGVFTHRKRNWGWSWAQINQLRTQPCEAAD